MYLIGLTGGIASGKSTVAKRLASWGAVGIDADQLAREVVEPGTPGLAAITAEFGDAILLADGTLNRPALGAVIFTDPSRRERLNAITHPAVRRLTRDRVAAAVAADPHAIIVYDVPLLAEAIAGGLVTFDLIVVVHADAETRIERMVELRGLTREEATHRIAAPPRPGRCRHRQQRHHRRDSGPGRRGVDSRTCGRGTRGRSDRRHPRAVVRHGG
jgi:dephospho-CoA kinase